MGARLVEAVVVVGSWCLAMGVAGLGGGGIYNVNPGGRARQEGSCSSLSLEGMAARV